MTTVTQGTVGLGKAISYFTTLGKTVLLPLNDNQDYDLVVESDSLLQKVQVKTTSFKSNTGYIVQLKAVRSNKTKNKLYPFDNNTVDIVFVYCLDGTSYSIPSKEVKVKSSLTLSKAWDRFKI